MSSDHSKFSRFRVISSEKTPEAPAQSFSFPHENPQPYDLRAEALGESEYLIGQPVIPRLSSAYASAVSEGLLSGPVQWVGISRCGQYSVSLTPKALRVTCGIGSKDQFIFHHPLSSEDLETHLEYLIRNDGDPLVASSFVSGKHEVWLLRPEMLPPGDEPIGSLLKRLYFRFCIITRDTDGNETHRVSFEVPIMKTYGRVVLSVSTLREAVIALQTPWLIRFDELEQFI